MKYCQYQSIDELRALKPEWDRLFGLSASTNYFLSHAWSQVTAETYFADAQILIACVYIDGELAALAPMMQQGRCIGFLMHLEIADYGDILFDPAHPEAMLFLLEKLVVTNQGMTIRFDNVPAFSHLLAIAKSVSEKCKTYHLQHEHCLDPVIDIQSGYTQYYHSNLGKRLRQEIRTTENHLKRLGSWTFSLASTKEEKRHFFSYLVAFHKNRQVGKAGRSIFDDPQHLAFFRKIIEAEYSVGGKLRYEVQLSAIILESRPISVALSLIVHDRLYYWIPSFDDTIPKVSLGKLHIKNLLQVSSQEGIMFFDFMGGQEPYKYQWTKDDYSLNRLVLFDSKWKYSLTLLVWRARSFLKELKSRSVVFQKLWILVSKVFFR